MILFLKILFAIVFVSQLIIVGWAISQESLFAIPLVVQKDPWFIATLTDAYFAFLAFFVWVCYREKTTLWRVIWFVAIASLGNIAMATYALIALFKLKPGAGVDDLFNRLD